MFLQLNHQKLDVYSVSRALVKECYFITKHFPPEEKFALVQQIRRAALSAHLNIAEGCSRKSETERKRYFEISRGSIIEIDAALDVSEDLSYCKKEDLKQFGLTIVRAFSMLSKMVGG
jgi:four helix bundle protein